MSSFTQTSYICVTLFYDIICKCTELVVVVPEVVAEVPHKLGFHLNKYYKLVVPVNLNEKSASTIPESQSKTSLLNTL